MLAFIIGSTFHEFMHAYTAWRLGDDTARRGGRVSLNPVVHFDPLGFFFFLLIALGVGFFAYAKPVMVNPGALRGGRRGMALVAIAGPLANLVLGAISAIPIRLHLLDQVPQPVYEVWSWFVIINFALFAFNLIPIPPLDGFNVLSGLVSNRWALLLQPLLRYGFAPLLVVLMLGYVLPQVNIIGRILSPVLGALQTVFLGA
jgi:Zn-dependent protease